MPLLWIFAAAMVLRPDLPVLTRAQAEAMTPAELGDALLAPGHPPIVEAQIGVRGTLPPPPPHAPLPVVLFAAPTGSSVAGFCERAAAHLLVPFDRDGGVDDPAAARASIETEQSYRWRGSAAGAAACDAPGQDFFSVDPGTEQRAFALIRAFAALQQRVRQGRPLAATVSIDDREAVRMQEFARTNTDHRIRPTREQMTPIVDARAALSALPIDEVTLLLTDRQSYQHGLKNSDLRGSHGTTRQVSSLFAGGEWSADLALDDGEIAVVRIVKAVPPPF